MLLSPEQKQIVDWVDDSDAPAVIVSAVAGSGKTHTIG